MIDDEGTVKRYDIDVESTHYTESPEGKWMEVSDMEFIISQYEVRLARQYASMAKSLEKSDERLEESEKALSHAHDPTGIIKRLTVEVDRLETRLEEASQQAHKLVKY